MQGSASKSINMDNQIVSVKMKHSLLVYQIANTFYCNGKMNIFTSWLDTSAWSFRVIPSPMADFINLESDGSTLIGG